MSMSVCVANGVAKRINFCNGKNNYIKMMSYCFFSVYCRSKLFAKFFNYLNLKDLLFIFVYWRIAMSPW
jgi:hypothetical protein